MQHRPSATDLRTPPPDAGNPALIAAIRAEMHGNGGRLTFADFMNLALYHPVHGYYLAPERRPGREGDFLTAPETHPFFGMTLARQIAECWERLGRPNPFTVREDGAGVGGLAYDIIAGLSVEAPELLATLRYRLVEANPYRREDAQAAMAEVGLDHLVAVEPPPSSDPDQIVGVALANEVADAFPVHRLVWRHGVLRERFVVWNDAGFGDQEADLSPEAEATDPMTTLVDAGVILHEGDAIEISPAAASWFGGVGRGLGRGYAIVVDYGYPAAQLYRDHRLTGTLRAHSRHTVTDDPFRHVGQEDLTAHVDFSALQRAGEQAGLTFAGLTTQGGLLASLGLGDLLVRMQGDPTTTAADYLATQAAVLRLIDPGGMGRFGVLIMARDAPVVPPLRGLVERGPAF